MPSAYIPLNITKQIAYKRGLFLTLRNTKIYLLRIMKKIIIFSAIITTLLFAVTPSVYAKQEIPKSPIPTWFSQVFQPFQNTIKSLAIRLENLEKRVTEIEKAIANLGKKKVDFNLPNQWSVSVYQEQNSKESFAMKTTEPNNSGLYISLPNSQSYCNWNGATISYYATVRAIAHLPTGDIYGAGSCAGIEFQSIENLPESGSTFEVEVYLWWQGTEKHTKQTITVPDRPFPSRDSLFLNPNNNGIIISPSGTIGIGTTTPTE